MKAPYKMLAVLLAAAFVSSCSIKEDRSLCPARLKLVLTPESVRLAGNGVCTARVAGRTGTASAGMDREKPWTVVDVQKDSVRVSCFLEAPLGYPSGTEYITGAGGQCDSIWACTHTLLPLGEEYCDSVALHKRFLTLTVEYLSAAGKQMPYDMCVLSSTAGTDLVTLDPIDGEFRCALQFGGDARASLRLPAQGRPSDLVLEIKEKENGEIVDVFPLGTELSGRYGYDWDAPDLADVSISMDFTRLSYSLAVYPWEDGGKDDMTL